MYDEKVNVLVCFSNSKNPSAVWFLFSSLLFSPTELKHLPSEAETNKYHFKSTIFMVKMCYTFIPLKSLIAAVLSIGKK